MADRTAVFRDGMHVMLGQKRDRSGLLDLLIFCFGVSAVFLCATAEAATPALLFEDSSVIGIGDTITALRLPVRTANGTFIFKDVTIVLEADSEGNLRWATARPIATLSPPLQTSNVRAGIYASATDKSAGLRITGPSAIGHGGVAEWAITVAPGKTAGRSPPNPAFFYTGPLSGSPLAARVQRVGLASSQYSFGVIGASQAPFPGFATNGLIGLRLIGNQLVIAAFSEDGRDHAEPVTEIVYTFER